jgi:hypothetical protein
MNKKYAVFIDGDNISSDYLDAIMTEIVKDNDVILIKRIYGDWTTPYMNSWKDKISDSPIRVFQQFRNGENATDNAIIIENNIVTPKLALKKNVVTDNKEIDLMTIFEYSLANSRILADGWISLADYGSTIKSKYPSFDPRTYGSIKLLPLIKTFKDIIEIKSDDCFPPNYYLRKIENNGHGT